MSAEVHKTYHPINHVLSGIHWIIAILLALASRLPKHGTSWEKMNWRWSTREVDIGCCRCRDNGENTASSEDLQIWPDIPDSSDLANLLHFHYHL